MILLSSSTDRHSSQAAAQRRRELEPRLGWFKWPEFNFVMKVYPLAIALFNQHGLSLGFQDMILLFRFLLAPKKAGFQLAPTLRYGLAGMTAIRCVAP